MQAVILAGGLGTRLKPFTLDNPKPMLKIENVPFLEHLLRQIQAWGITRVVILLGYKAEVVQEYFGDGEELGMDIRYAVTPVEYDTGARLFAAKELLDDEFILMYCDNYCPIPFEEAYTRYLQSGCAVQITAYANKDGYTKNNLRVQGEQVIAYDKKRVMPDLDAVDIGYAFMKKTVLDRLPQENVNFEAAVYPGLVAENQMGVYLTEHRYYSIGSWERIELTKEFFKEKKVVFLDRDGTLNVRPPKACYVEDETEFIWLERAKEAVKLLKDHDYFVFLITNQPGIARGILTEEQVAKIHKKMRSELQEIGADIDGIYMCPHGWNDNCECRKPKPGMLYQAQKEHSLNLPECVLIGDDDRDIEAGNAANLKKCIKISDDYTLWDAVNDLLMEEEKIQCTRNI
jgi:D-glycero-D-manno-heptose 1,7-bisphosphate phosphatase